MQNKWLKQGKKTKVTPKVKKIADSISGEDLKLIKNITEYIK